MYAFNILPGMNGVSTGFYGTKLLINEDIPEIVSYKERFATFKHPYIFNVSCSKERL